MDNPPEGPPGRELRPRRGPFPTRKLVRAEEKKRENPVPITIDPFEPRIPQNRSLEKKEKSPMDPDYGDPIIELRPRRNSRNTAKLNSFTVPIPNPHCCKPCGQLYCFTCNRCHTPGCRAGAVVCAEAQNTLMNAHRPERVAVPTKKKRPWWAFWR